MWKRITIIFLILCCILLVGCGSDENGWDKLIPNKKDFIEQQKLETQTESELKNNEETKKDDIEEKFNNLKNKCIEQIKDTEINESNNIFAFESIESSFFEIKNMSKWEEENDNLVKFVLGISYFYEKYEDGTIEKRIGDIGWSIMESLYTGKDDILKLIDIFKENYEKTGRHLFEEFYKSGQYKVGIDIKAGEYIFFTNSSSGYFCLSSDSNGNDIIANDNFSYNSIITIRDGEYLELSRCYAVPIEEVNELPVDSATMFKIGVHLPSGEYKLVSDSDRGYYCVYSDNRQDDIESNDNFSGQSYVTVSDGEYLTLSRCHIE